MKISKKIIWSIIVVAYLLFSYYSLLLDKFMLEEVAFDGKYKFLWIFMIAIVVFVFMFFMVKVFDLVKDFQDRKKKRSD